MQVSAKLSNSPAPAIADRRERDADRHQPRELEPVRERAEDRLDDRGADRHHQQQHARGAERVAALLHQERDQRGNRPLTQVRRGMATCEGGQSAAVQILHGATSKHQL